MKTGISTASLFTRMPTEDALAFLSKNNVDTTEIFLESFCEYKKEFGTLLKGVKGNTEVHSVHSLTTQFEPQLYSVNERAQADSFFWLDQVMQTANEVNAKYFTFHGQPRYKRKNYNFNMDNVCSVTQKIIDAMAIRGVSLAFENVHWCVYNYVGFFKELKKRTTGLKGTLDIKQARLSEVPYKDFIEEMGSDIVTVHVSDVSSDGKMCLPGKGVTDFKDLFSRLRDVGFDGAVLLEVYQNDYKDYRELFDSLQYIKGVAESIFNK